MEESKGRPKLLIAIVVALVVVIAALTSAFVYVATLPASGTPREIRYPIGLAIAVSGASYGAGEGAIRRDAALLAIDQMNERLAAAGSPIRFTAIHEDTKGTAQDALAALQTLASAGVKVVVGPLSSTEVGAIKDFVNRNKIVSISPSSTGVSLAIPKEYVFRAAPTDAQQAKALAQLVSTLGYKKVAIIARNDDYGRELANLFERRFTDQYGGITKKLTFTPGQADYATEVQTLHGYVEGFGIGPQTAVLIVAFDKDGLNIFGLARLDNTLKAVRWFGSESLKRTSFLPPTAPPEIGDFLVQTKLTGFFPSPERNPVTVAFEQAYKAKYTKDPSSSPYSYYSYDAAWLAMMAILAAGKYDGEAVKGILPTVAEKYIGASGYKRMDANGDVAGADYRAWLVIVEAEKYKFKEIGVWRFTTEELTIFP